MAHAGRIWLYRTKQPEHYGMARHAVSALVMACALLLFAPAADAAKFFDSFFPNPAPAAGLGGAFNSPRDIAVRHATGQVYVVDQASHRIQRFAPDGTFERAWGVDVVNGVANPGAAGDTAGAGFEICVTAAHCKAGLTLINAGDNLRNGSMDDPQGIDINQSTGAVYVRDRDNRRVNEYTPDGAFVRSWGFDVAQPPAAPAGSAVFETCLATDVCKAGVTGSGVGQFATSSTSDTGGVAVAPAGAPNAGEVFLVDPGNGRLQRFTVPASPIGAVVPGAPFGAAGTIGDNEFGPNHPRHVAVDADGVVYGSNVFGSNAPLVNRYDTISGTFMAHIGDGTIFSVMATGAINSLEVDPASGHLLVGRPSDLGIMEFDLADQPAVVDESHLVGDPAENSLRGLGIATSTGQLGIDPGTGRYYVSVTSGGAAGSGTGARILVLDADGTNPVPVVELFPATAVGATDVTLHAAVDPVLTTNFPTSYRFEVSKDGIVWDEASAPALVGGDGFTPDDSLVANVAGLEANTLYRFRVRVTRSPSAGSAVSAEQIFVTDAAPPTVQSSAAQHVGDTGAQLVGRLNPGGLATSYWFEWGDTDYGNTIPLPAGQASGSVEVGVAEALDELEPNSVYHFRLCAQNALTAVKTCGLDRAFTTRSPGAVPDGRAYEMATAPDKVLRRGGQSTNAGDEARFSASYAPPGGGTLLWGMYTGVTDPASEAGWSGDFVYERRTRQDRDGDGYADGWFGLAATNIPPVFNANGAVNDLRQMSADALTQVWDMQIPLFSNESRQSVHVMGDTGGPRAAGWYPWLDPAWFSGDPTISRSWGTKIDDVGQHLVGYSESSTGKNFRDVTPLDAAVSPEQMTPPQTAGKALFKSGPEHDWRPADLVNECSGAGAATTLLPARDDEGTPTGPAGTFSSLFASFPAGSTTLTADPFVPFPAGILPGHFVSGPGIAPDTRVVTRDSASQITIDTPTTAAVPPEAPVSLTIGQNLAKAADDTIATRPCGGGAPTDVRGAALGSGAAGDRLGRTQITSVSDNGRRVFFVSPDPAVGGAGQATCAAGDTTGEATRCPGQLFVRQYASDGTPTVRWVSRAENALFAAPQNIAALGNGVAFEGASLDGSVVYFRTNAPLTTDDPNGGNDPVSGSASPTSWDLYRYDLGVNNDLDPAAGDPGDRLTRISGGPSGDEDPNTNCTTAAADCGGAANGGGAAVRFMSDDGSRVYFVTAAPIPGADNSARDEDATVPGGGAQANTATRNLYLYDASKSGAAAYRFVARVPFAFGGASIDQCLSASSSGASTTVAGFALRVGIGSCIRGTSSGDAVVLWTAARLTADDLDDAADIYVYEATKDTLTRISAPDPEAEPYVCAATINGVTLAECNADPGLGGSSLAQALGTEGKGSGIGAAGMRSYNFAEDDQGRLKAVYFESQLPLVPDKTNGGHMDVFEWRDGELSLISPGDSPESAFYTGNSRDGRDVFFWTEQRISGWEIDAADGDVYNATSRPDPIREPSPPPPICDVLVGGCHAAGAPPTARDPRTSSPADGNAEAGERKTIAIRGISAKARKRAAKTGVLSLRVLTTGAGKLTVVARGKVGGRNRVLGRAAKAARGAGETSVALRLNAAARKHLRAGRPLAVSIQAQQAGAARARTITIRLRQGGSR